MSDTALAFIGFCVGYGFIGEVLVSRLAFGECFYLTKRTFGWKD